MILDHTCADEATAWGLSSASGYGPRAESCDTFCPLGPRIVRDLDPADVAIRTRVNGEPRQKGTTARLLRPVP